MSRGVNKKKRILDEIAELEAKRRSGLVRVIAAIVVFVVATAVKESLVAQGVELASDMIVNALFFAMAVVLAGVAGFGSRDYARASNAIRELQSRLK